MSAKLEKHLTTIFLLIFLSIASLLLMGFMYGYSSIVAEVNLRSAHPDTRETEFIKPEQVEQIVLQLTGGWINKSDPQEFFDDVKKLYLWVESNIHYSPDPDYPILPTTPFGEVEYTKEMWRFPKETIMSKTGDCEDIAILLTSMLVSYVNGTLYVETIVVDSHAATYVSTGSKICILDPAVHYYTSANQQVTFKNVTTEISNWLEYVRQFSASDITVKWVFSNTLWKSFSGTDEFISWLTSRPPKTFPPEI
ncbi:MAG TPA: transglutaminase domain-containing protein [Thermococcus sp.]|nr:transglutaminase domain-containing protein [Thermococcus sp.]